MSKKVTLYISSVSGNMVIKKNQQHLEWLLQSKGCDLEIKDVAADPAAKEEMVEISGGKKLVPQVCVDGKYLGGREEVDEIVEDERFDEVFL